MRIRGIAAAAIVGAVVALASAATAAAPHPYVWLGGHWIDKKHGWSYFAQKPPPPEGAGPHGSQRPCIAVSSLIREGRSLRVSETELCYGAPQYLSAKSEPLIVTKTIFANDDGAATAVGVAASHAARYLKLVLKDRTLTIRLHELNRIQARKIGVKPFRHAGFVLRGEWCIAQVLVLNTAKAVLWDSGSGECPAESANRRAMQRPLPALRTKASAADMTRSTRMRSTGRNGRQLILARRP